MLEQRVSELLSSGCTPARRSTRPLAAARAPTTSPRRPPRRETCPRRGLADRVRRAAAAGGGRQRRPAPATWGEVDSPAASGDRLPRAVDGDTDHAPATWDGTRDRVRRACRRRRTATRAAPVRCGTERRLPRRPPRTRTATQRRRTGARRPPGRTPGRRASPRSSGRASATASPRAWRMARPRTSAMTEIIRCAWPATADPIYTAYHDEEWGRPVQGDDAVFERVTLEAFQSGLSWLTILRKRENFRAAFDGFSIPKVGRLHRGRRRPAARRRRHRPQPGQDRGGDRQRQGRPRAARRAVGPGLALRRPGRSRRPGRWPTCPAVTPASKALAKELKKPRLPLRRPHHRLRADAGHRPGQRPHRGLRGPRRPVSSAAGEDGALLGEEGTWSRPGGRLVAAQLVLEVGLQDQGVRQGVRRGVRQARLVAA